MFRWSVEKLRAEFTARSLDFRPSSWRRPPSSLQRLVVYHAADVRAVAEYRIVDGRIYACTTKHLDSGGIARHRIVGQDDEGLRTVRLQRHRGIENSRGIESGVDRSGSPGAERVHRRVIEREELGFGNESRDHHRRAREQGAVGADAVAGIVHFDMIEVQLQRVEPARLHFDRAGIGAVVIERDVAVGEIYL